MGLGMNLKKFYGDVKGWWNFEIMEWESQAVKAVFWNCGIWQP